ncbi:hypothetical protein J2T13_003649 [Paenibacillus sp. DS2015]|uniref:hypothetical protein n=1 Tax=Paenibacillus sp. DS2015 TaxID=3373917 RepID=UPI003D1B6EAD
MDLKFVNEEISSHSGYGAGPGVVISREYECPCGAGRVIYEKDDIPGFRDSGTFCKCKECDGKYNFGDGTATEK